MTFVSCTEQNGQNIRLSADKKRLPKLAKKASKGQKSSCLHAVILN
ncbi:hypothetical protein GARC_1421 [Paraglaciecola arctica BSs20135]|uniref:Uncharacterized protein n=1 Tax=Paraglaciecola arctica BSs20135 TaxID=493475 RepID=K6Y384_9ALTE|nr:hypothetical protein GARC_1421 [Paraglaciecola arctica BSs20135]